MPMRSNYPSERPADPRVPAASSSIGPWVWLFPLAYGLHIAEEYWLHFPDWVSRVSQAFVSNTQFLVLNGAFWLLMVGSVIAIRARTSLAWLVATLAAILGINAALHLLGSLVTRTYSPGSITAAFLYVPLVLYAFSAGPSADCPWYCTAGRSSWCGHPCGRHVPGGATGRSVKWYLSQEEAS